MPHEHRRAPALERKFNDMDRAIHPGTKAARSGNQYVQGWQFGRNKIHGGGDVAHAPADTRLARPAP